MYLYKDKGINLKKLFKSNDLIFIRKYQRCRLYSVSFFFSSSFFQ